MDAMTPLAAYVPDVTWNQVAPFIILTLGGLLILALDALLDIIVKGITPQRRDTALQWVTMGTLLVTGATFYGDILGTDSRPFFEGMLRVDEFGNLGALIILFGSLVFTAMAPRLIQSRRLPAGELYALQLFAVGGMTLLAVANELITAFICIEILSLALYVLTGIDRRSARSGEASFKYFILGAFASAFLVLGIAFIFGSTGTTQLYGDHEPYAAAPQAEELLEKENWNLGLTEVLATGQRVVNATEVTAVTQADGSVETIRTPIRELVPINPIWVFTGFVLIFAGLCFKLSLAPFHMWAPDVYEGAPTIVAMYIATASKVAVFGFLVHLVQAMSAWAYFSSAALFLLSAVAAASILWGNFAALIQSNMKRMLAYSSVAHGGYIMVGIAALACIPVIGDPLASERIRQATVFYLFAYTLMNILAFGIAAYLGREGEGDIKAYRGLSKRRPLLAAGMALAMISLLGLGIPGTVGFWGKYFVLKEAVNAAALDPTSNALLWLVWIALIGSAISAFYYLRVVVAMYMQPEEEGAPVAGAALRTENGYTFMIGLSASMTFFFGILPALFWAVGAF